MVKIRNLSGTDKVVSDDLLPVWVNAQGDTRKASMNTVKTFMQSNILLDASSVTYTPEGTGAVATTRGPQAHRVFRSRAASRGRST